MQDIASIIELVMDLTMARHIKAPEIVQDMAFCSHGRNPSNALGITLQAGFASQLQHQP